jgi:two-component system NtrC family response regulator
MANILIVDDDSTIARMLTMLVDQMGHHCESAGTIHDAMKLISSGSFDLVILDVMLPDGDSINMVPKIKESPSIPEVIIITGNADPDGAEMAIKNGAWDYIMKPFSIGSITLKLTRALEYRKEKKTSKLPVVLNREDIIGKSPLLNSALNRLAQAAGSRANTLIVGETGTGKELFAKAIHQNSPIADQRFVVVDCAALPESLIESTLFGHERGAFTGADVAREGLVKQADGGTLFLDEVGELPLSIQKTFLRVIQEQKFRSISGRDEIKVNFRLIAATNRDLNEMVRRGRFRSDLLFRLRSLNIELPPLRMRSGDIKELTIYHTNKLCEIYSTETKGFSPDFFDALNSYGWPGNVRELYNALEDVLSNARQEPTIFSYHLPTHIRAHLARISVDNRREENTVIQMDDPFEMKNREHFPKFKEFRLDMENRYLKKCLTRAQDNRKKACAISGLSRTRLFELLKKHSLT